ncbi:LAMI_0C09714g1_1 [Lachancea mirantina]|uniref:LAMI_0C09714g1_1 n=1 Tax=Lachancea mirantina TaxID=1230905 RepID=A0A1G4J5A8_9SACH|nr:LAMI_0C09714g1_1 [Lachancea mirantina]
MNLTGREIRIISLIALDTAFFLLEIIVGYTAHSLALVADSFHMLNDIFSLVVALWAVRVAKNKGADAKYTYGWKRAEILGALINAVFLIALCMSILIEAIQRFFEPQEVKSPKLVLGVGSAGLVSNIVGLFLFHEHGHSHGHSHDHSHDDGAHDHDHDHAADEEQGHMTSPSQSPSMDQLSDSRPINDMLPSSVVESFSPERTPLLASKDATANAHDHDHDHDHKKGSGKSLNMHGVFLHVLGDALGNVGVMATALFIWKTDYSWRFYSDPLVSLVITVIIFCSALPLSRKASRILLQATPTSISADRVRQDIMNINGVVSVHDFHIWNLTENFSIASIHVQIDATPDQFMEVAKLIRNIFHRYGIHSATVQPEFIHGNLGPDTYRRFSRIAGGGTYGSSMSLDNPTADTSAYGATTSETRCIVDEAAQCNADECLPPAN